VVEPPPPPCPGAARFLEPQHASSGRTLDALNRAHRLVSELRGDPEPLPWVREAIRRYRSIRRCGPGVVVELEWTMVDLRGQWRPLDVTPRRYQLTLDGGLRRIA